MKFHRKSSHYFFLMSETFPEKNTRKLSWPFFSNLSVWDLTPMYGWDATLKEAVRLHVSKANLSRRRSVPPADEEPRSQEATFETRVTCNSLGIQSPCQSMIGVSNHLLSIVFRFHYHSQKVIGSLGIITDWLIGDPYNGWLQSSHHWVVQSWPVVVKLHLGCPRKLGSMVSK